MRRKPCSSLTFLRIGRRRFVDAPDRALEVHRVGQGKEGRWLDRDVDPRRVAPVEAVAADRLPIAVGFLQGPEEFQVHLHEAFGLLFADRRLAEDIDRQREAVLADLLDVFQGVLDILADDELPGHAFEVGADGPVEDGAGDLAAEDGAFGPPLHHRRHILVLRPEVLLDVAVEGLRGVEIGQDVDEAEELDLEVFILHRPVHDLAGPPALVENGRGLAADAGEKLLAACGYLPVKRSCVHMRLVQRKMIGELLIFSRFPG